MSIIKWKSLEEIVYRANNTAFGLAAGIWTQNTDTANYLIRGIKAGTIWYAHSTSSHICPAVLSARSGDIPAESRDVLINLVRVCVYLCGRLYPPGTTATTSLMVSHRGAAPSALPFMCPITYALTCHAFLVHLLIPSLPSFTRACSCVALRWVQAIRHGQGQGRVRAYPLH